MGLVHIVLFKFKADASIEDVQQTCSAMLALKNTCVHPSSQLPYIKSLTGGTDNSSEGLQNGITHAFVAEFETPEHRDYYIKEDPTHLAFVQNTGAIIEKAIVVDYFAGVFIPGN